MVNRDIATPFNPKCPYNNQLHEQAISMLNWGLQDDDSYTIANYPSLISATGIGQFSNNSKLIAINAPKLTTATDIMLDDFSLGYNDKLTDIYFPALTTATHITIDNTRVLEYLNLNALTSIEGNAVDYLNIFDIQGSASNILPLIVSLPKLQKCVTLNIQRVSNVTLDISNLTNSTGGAITAGDAGINYCPYLTTITLSPLTGLTTSMLYMAFFDNALTQANVDEILSRVDGWGRSNGSIELQNNTNGTNEAPTGGAANANVLSLQGKGWTVLHA